jgi:hypothetical protein
VSARMVRPPGNLRGGIWSATEPELRKGPMRALKKRQVWHLDKAVSVFAGGAARARYLHQFVVRAYMIEQRKFAQMREIARAKALHMIADEAFEAMEGAGMPEFGYYDRWHHLARTAMNYSGQGDLPGALYPEARRVESEPPTTEGAKP